MHLPVMSKIINRVASFAYNVHQILREIAHV